MNYLLTFCLIFSVLLQISILLTLKDVATILYNIFVELFMFDDVEEEE